MRIHDCAARGNIDGVQAELRKGVPVDARDEKDFTPLARAAESLDADEHMLRLLIEAGADVNAAVEEGKDFPLSLAVGAGDLKRLAVLLKAGANVNQVADAGYSALLHAMYRLCQSDHLVPVATLLIESGAALDHQSNYGESPLKVASMQERLDAVRFLIEAGADRVPCSGPS
jgi:ankyrin repeat protein